MASDETESCPYCGAEHVDGKCDECGDFYCDECLDETADFSGPGGGIRHRVLCPNCDGRAENE